MAAFLSCPVLQIVRREARVLCNTGEHPWADFLSVVEGEDKIRIALSTQDSM
jgi:hypothetical protein